jgi:RNA polymerase sigma-70 factor (ECF subfamily)
MTRVEFNDLVKQLSRKLYYYAFRMLKDQMSAEDVVQEVFLKLWNMNTRLNEYRSIDALATAMVRNSCIDQIRKSRFIQNEAGNIRTFAGPDNPSPQEALELSETMLILDRIIGMLPDNYRELVRLRDIEGLSYEKISEMTKLNINSLRVNLSRARKFIRNEFIKYSDEHGRDKKAAGEIL